MKPISKDFDDKRMIDDSNRELVEMNSVEGEVLIVDWMQGASDHSGFHLLIKVGMQYILFVAKIHLVLLFREKL